MLVKGSQALKIPPPPPPPPPSLSLPEIQCLWNWTVNSAAKVRVKFQSDMINLRQSRDIVRYLILRKLNEQRPCDIIMVVCAWLVGAEDNKWFGWWRETHSDESTKRPNPRDKLKLSFWSSLIICRCHQMTRVWHVGAHQQVVKWSVIQWPALSWNVSTPNLLRENVAGRVHGVSGKVEPIEAETKCPFRGRHFQMQLFEWKCLYFD